MRYRQREFKDNETISYSLKLTVELYERIRKLSQDRKESIAYTIQRAIEKCLEEEEA